jgi:catechol 2,3-dioxygenase-like lactoylglutathione lyase family enzyme
MFDHVSLKVRDFPKSLAFYRAALGALGYEAQQLDEQEKSVGFGPEGAVALWLAEGVPHASTHLAFKSPSRTSVSQFFDAGLSSGGKDNGKPGLRPDYAKGYYAAFLFDPDGNNVEAVAHGEFVERMDQRFLEAVASQQPHPSLGVDAETYGRIVGSWRGEMQSRLPGHSSPPASLEIHCAWALEGRAVQDVWITPARDQRAKGVTASLPPLDWFGTTIRVFDPETKIWRATWLNAITGDRIDLEGVRQGDDIVQVGLRQGRPIRWAFREIRPESFVWQGHILELDGVTWRLEIEIHARRER